MSHRFVVLFVTFFYFLFYYKCLKYSLFRFWIKWIFHFKKKIHKYSRNRKIKTIYFGIQCENTSGKIYQWQIVSPIPWRILHSFTIHQSEQRGIISSMPWHCVLLFSVHTTSNGPRHSPPSWICWCRKCQQSRPNQRGWVSIISFTWLYFEFKVI